MKPYFFLKIFLLGIVVLTIYSCSKDRLTPVENEDISEEINPFKDKSFENPRNLPIFSKLASTAEKIRISNINQLPIITKKGTKLWIYDYNVRTPQGGSATYPFDIDIIELYTLKDMILHQKPTTSYDRMLVTGGALYLNVSKNGTNLNVNIQSPPQISVPVIKREPDQKMLLFYETEDSAAANNVTWTEAPRDSIRNPEPLPNQKPPPPPIFAGKQSYELFPRRFGWINCDKFLDYAGDKTIVTFISPKLGLENIVVFMVFPDINSVIRVYGGKSLDVPVGENVKIIALAETKEGEVFAFFNDIKVKKIQSVEIDLNPSTEKEVLAALDKL